MNYTYELVAHYSYGCWMGLGFAELGESVVTIHTHLAGRSCRMGKPMYDVCGREYKHLTTTACQCELDGIVLGFYDEKDNDVGYVLVI